MSSKTKLVITRKLPSEIEARANRSYEVKTSLDDRLFSPDELIDFVAGAQAIVPCHTERFPAEILARLPASVKVIANFSVGVDHVDLDAAKQRGIIVTNTPDVLSDATAEVAMLLLLGAARRGAEGDRLLRAKRWQDWSPSFMVGAQPTGRRLGIIGMGRVGQVVARRARGFDMTVHYFNRNRLAADHECGAIYHDSLESLLPVCDYLSLNCPATEQTNGLLNRNTIGLLPDGAIVVNTARGALVDDEALVEALRSGKVGAAGLDVFNGEPGALHPGYAELENTFLLPHVGSATHDTRIAMGMRALDNVDAVFAGQEPRDRVA
jgi:lactate dehydrogenase-like 2-hydroxyacid dehydrogenase